jgi:hypothetical protein
MLEMLEKVKKPRRNHDHKVVTVNAVASIGVECGADRLEDSM